MKTNTSSIAFRAPRSGLDTGLWHEALMNLLRRGWRRIKHQRRVRHDVGRLLEFDDHLLADIGISRADLMHSIAYGRLSERSRAGR